MDKLSIFDIVNRMKEDNKKVVIVGAGMLGQYVLAHMRKEGVEPVVFFDNKVEAGLIVEGIEVTRPKLLSDGHIYIISVKDESTVQVLYEQLKAEGITETNILIQEYYPQTYDFRSELQECDLKKNVDMDYYDCYHRLMDWDAPRTYNERINWEKVYVRDKRKTQLADKYLVRAWIEEKIGRQYLNEIYGVWDNAEDIDYSLLPEQFVLKINNGSLRNIIVTDKTSIDKEAICKQLNEWKAINFGHLYLEAQYRDIVPKIICEKYLAGLGEQFYDYDIFCFHGEPKYIQCISGCHREGAKAAFYDTNWNKQTFTQAYIYDEENAPRPKNLEKMLELSRTLAKEFDHVRVDWFEYPDSADGFLFSEMTFSTWGGKRKFIPEEYDTVFGALI